MGPAVLRTSFLPSRARRDGRGWRDARAACLRDESGPRQRDRPPSRLTAFTASIKDQLSVGGLSTDDNQSDAVALINGVAFHQGDTVPIDVDEKTLQELDQLAQSFGLTLTR